MKKIALIGQFPPPLHGLSKALDTLYNSKLNEDFLFLKYDITNNKYFFNNLWNVFVSKNDIYYLTISQSIFGNMRDLVLLQLVLLKKKKVIIHLHGGGFYDTYISMNFIQRILNRKILGKVDIAIVLGDSLRYIFKGIIEESKIRVVKNCVDDEYKLLENQIEKKFEILEKKSQFRILYLSNFIKEKGYYEVLKLAKYSSKYNENFKFDFAGKFFSDKEEKEFIEFIEKNNLQHIVTYHGIVEGKEKINLLEKCDYLILLTTYKNEGQPISIIEAVINGLGIITTNHAGIGDILPYNQMITIDKESIDISKIYKMINNDFLHRESLVERVKNNREQVCEKFSEKEYVNSMLQIFKDV